MTYPPLKGRKQPIITKQFWRVEEKGEVQYGGSGPWRGRGVRIMAWRWTWTMMQGTRPWRIRWTWWSSIVCLILQQQRKLTTGHLADLSAHIIRVKQDGTEQQKQVFLLKAQESSFQCKIALCNVSLHWFKRSRAMLCHLMAFLEIHHHIINSAVFVLGTCSVNIGVFVLVLNIELLFHARVDSHCNPCLSKRSTFQCQVWWRCINVLCI